MNRRTMLLGATAIPATLVVTSCASITGYLTPEQQAIVTQVQQAVIKACSFLPTVQSIVALIGVFAPGAGMVGAIAAAICGAMPSAPAAGQRAGVPASFMVNGVAVSGVYTR